MAFGQIFRQTPSSQFSETSGLSGIKSDILISGNVTYNSLINLHGQQLYDENFNLKQAETTLVLTQDDKKLSSGLFLDNDNHQNTSQRLSELTLGLESDLSKNWTTNLILDAI